MTKERIATLYDATITIEPSSVSQSGTTNGCGVGKKYDTQTPLYAREPAGPADWIASESANQKSGAELSLQISEAISKLSCFSALPHCNQTAIPKPSSICTCDNTKGPSISRNRNDLITTLIIFEL